MNGSQDIQDSNTKGDPTRWKPAFKSHWFGETANQAGPLSSCI